MVTTSSAWCATFVVLELLPTACHALASYLARDRCDVAIEAGTVMMGWPARASLEARLQVVSSTSDAVNFSLTSDARYVEYVVETASGYIDECDGTLGCEGTRCAVRRLNRDRRPITVRRGTLIKCAWAHKYGAVNILDEAAAFPSRIVWSLHVGCDRSGFFVELLGLARALDDELRREGSELSIDGVRCADVGDLFDAEADAIRRLTTSTEPASHEDLVIAHGAQCNSIERVTVARVMVERVFAMGRDKDVYACARRATQVWTPTRWNAAQFAAAGIPPHSIVVMPVAVDSNDAFSPDATAADVASRTAIEARLGGVDEKTWTALCVAKWERRKGFDVLIDGVLLLDDVRLLFHSYKPSWEPGEANLQKLADARRARVCLGRPRCAAVQWLGDEPLTRSLMRALYARCDAFILATRGEGWGLPVHEAMAMALPVVVVNASGIADLVGDNAILLPAHGIGTDGLAKGPTAREVADALTFLRSEPDRADQLGRRARQHVKEHFSPRVVASKMRAALSSVYRPTQAFLSSPWDELRR